MSGIPIHRKYDSIDATEIEETARSSGYALIRGRQLEQRQQYVDALIQAQTWDEARLLQGQIRSVDRSLEIPKIMRQEIAASNERRRKHEKS